jgi:hypothetical protein
VAVGVGEVAFGRGANMCEDQRGRRLRGYPRQVDAVPGGNCGREDARLRSKRGRSVVADTEAIAVVWTAAVLQSVSHVSMLSWSMLGAHQAEARVKRLCKYRV